MTFVLLAATLFNIEWRMIAMKKGRGCKDGSSFLQFIKKCFNMIVLHIIKRKQKEEICIDTKGTPIASTFANQINMTLLNIDQKSAGHSNTTDSRSTGAHKSNKNETYEYEIDDPNKFEEVDMRTAGEAMKDLHEISENKTLDDENLPKDSTKTVTKSIYYQILHQIDLRLLPFTVAVHFFSQLDKHNLGQAHARDLDADLHLQGNQFAALLSLYFPCYLVLHYISGIFLAQLKPRRLIPTTVVWCGLTTFCLTFCTNFTQMAIGRLLLGMFEGSLSPCITILFASWYPNEQIAKRLMLLHLSGPTSGLAGACVTAGFFELDGMDGMQGWQWMFCVEGLTTFICAFPGFWLLPNLVEQDGVDFETEEEKKAKLEKSKLPVLRKLVQRFQPSNFPVLKPDQKDFWIANLQRQSGPLRRINDFTWHQVLRPFTEVKIYLYAITAAAGQVANSNMANFGPMIIREMGYEGAKINLLSAGPLALAIVVMLFCADLADRKGLRALLLLPCLCMITIGQSLIFFDIHKKSVTYGAMYLVAGFSGPCNTLITIWCAGNIGPQYTKMAAMALVMLSHTSATLISVNLFPPTDAPLFWHAHLAGLIGILIALLSASILTFLLWNENRQKEKKNPLRSIDPAILKSALQIQEASNEGEGEEKNGKGVEQARKSETESEKSILQPLSDDEARVFWHLEHLTNEEFARLGDRHPGVRYAI